MMRVVAQLSSRTFLTDHMRSIEEQVRRAAYRRFADAGYGAVRPPHLKVMAALAGDRLSLTRLAAVVGVSKQAAGKLVDHLEALGYVERTKDSADRRAVVIRVTSKALPGYVIGRAAITDWEAAVKKRLGARRFAELRRSLEEIDSWMADRGWQ
jgi:DNA-binding MarR family transcriptional regulator